MRLGWYIRLYAPMEFDLIMQTAGHLRPPSADLVEAVSYASANPYFRTQEFRMLLIKYRAEGCYTPKAKKPPTPKQIRKYAERRMEMLKG